MPISTGFYATKEKLIQRLDESTVGKIQILTGPRQVGKTTILLDIAKKLEKSADYLALDTPEASLPGWWELQWKNAVEKSKNNKLILLLDEVQYFPNWSRVIKSCADQIYKDKLPIQIVLTGSAALELGTGIRETMAGRFERLVLRQWNAQDLSKAFNMTMQKAIETYVLFGSFPGGINFLSDLPRWKSYMQDSIIEPAIGKDILVLESIRKPTLLRQIFAICTNHPSEILSLKKIAGEISDSGTLETIAHYLGLLEQAYLVAALQKYSSKEIRRRSSPQKVVPLSNSFPAASSIGEMSFSGTNKAIWSRLVENACLAFAIACEQNVYYWREEPIEVDGVFIGSWGKWAVEIKTGNYTSKDLVGLLEFCKRNNDFKPLVICDEDHISTAEKIGVTSLSWNEFLWRGI